MKKIFRFLSSKKQKEENSSEKPLDPKPEATDPFESVRDMVLSPEELFGPNGQTRDILKDFDKASKYLSVRIYNRNFAQGIKEEEFFIRKDLDETVSVLVLDLPESVESVLRSYIGENWPVSEDELFRIALENCKDKYPRFYDKQENRIIRITGEDDVLITTDALVFEKHEECLGKFGTIFSIPTRDHLLCIPINNDLDLEVGLEVLIPYADQLCEQNPEEAICRHIYWHYQGKNELIYSYIGLERVKYVLPLQLEDLVY